MQFHLALVVIRQMAKQRRLRFNQPPHSRWPQAFTERGQWHVLLFGAIKNDA